MVLDQLPLVRLRFDLIASEAADVPAYKGDLLRMALLWWLSEYWCPLATRCRQGCRRPDVCAFGQLNEPPMDPNWPASIQRLIGESPPPAYALWDCQDRRARFEPGTLWAFELTLAGAHAVRQIPGIVAAIQQGAEQGMGRIRLRSKVRHVAAVIAKDDGEETVHPVAEEKDTPEGPVLAWANFALEALSFGYAAGAHWATRFGGPVRWLTIRYLSPIKLKEKGTWIETPVFDAVMRSVVRRLRLMSQVHGGGEWPQADYGPLLDLAETVQLEHDETLWTGYRRHSQRSGSQEVEGFVGQAWYSGEDLRPLLPALWLGQWLQIGKAYVLGNGRYVIESVSGTA
jgi:hypothetical protein